MPAIITHDFFGRDVYDALYARIGGSRDEADAFLLGNQGPDPLFYVVATPHLARHHRLGSLMHAEKPSELIAQFKQAINLLEPHERAVGRAYALGFLCHYTLDSTMHPLVYRQEYDLCDAGEPGLSRDDGGEVHAVIESELDELVLFTKRGQTVATFNPSREILRASAEVLRIVSKLYASAALNVYGQVVPASLFTAAVIDFRLVQSAFYSPSGTKREAIGSIERLVRNHSFFQAMSHRPVELTESAFDNHAHAAWSNPFTGEVRTASFWDLYDEAQAKARANIAAFDDDAFGLEAARALTGELNFSGKPVAATILAVEDASACAPAPAAPPATA